MTDDVRTQTLSTSAHIPVDLIDPNPEQPRQTFDEDQLKELAGSIKANGVIQPIVVEITGDGGRYILHDGERRLRASKLAGLAEIPAYILEPGADKKQLLIRAVVANVQRADLTPIEQARAFQEMAGLGMTDQEIANQVGKSRATIANARRLLNLPEAVQQKVGAEKDQLSERQAMALLPYYQLPEPVRKKVAGSWQVKPMLSQPEKYTSDQIRDKVNDGLRQITTELKLFQPGDEMGGPGVRHSKCDDCPFFIPVKKEKVCSDRDCYNAKVKVWQVRQLAAAEEVTGLKSLSPGRSLRYDESSGFGHDEQPALEQALQTSCPHLLLTCQTYEGTYYLRPEGVSPYVRYLCLHPGKGEKSCKCRHALKQAEIAREKADKAEVRRIRAKTTEAVAQALSGAGTAALKALALHVSSYSQQDKIKASDDPAFLAGKIAGVLVGNIYEGSGPNDYQARINAWLQEIGLPVDGQTRVTELEQRLARILEWSKCLLKEIPTVEAIKGNITNVSKLAEEAQEQALAGPDQAGRDRLQAIFDQVDLLKSRLLELLPVVEERSAEVQIDHVSWLITVPPGDTNFKGHLANANTATLSYTLALLAGEGEGNKTRIATLLSRLMGLEQAEALDLKPIRTKLKQIQKWAKNGAAKASRQVIINKGMALDDLEYDLNKLIEQHGQTEALVSLKAELDRTTQEVETIRKNQLAGVENA